MWLLALLHLSLVTTFVQALYVTAGSPCASICNIANGTWVPDLVCSDSDYSTEPKGILMKDCLQCLGQSLYINGTRSDQYWYLYHMKFTQQYCLIDTNSNLTAPVQKCGTECSPLRRALSVLWLQQQPFLPQYSYCTNDSNAYPTYGEGCARCLQAQKGAVVLGNFADTMVNACRDKPQAIYNDLVKPTRDLFNDTVIPTDVSTSTSASNSISSSSAVATLTSTSTSSPDAQSTNANTASNAGLSAGAAAGIGIGVTVVVVGVAAAAAVVYFSRGRKQRKSSLHSGENAPMYMPESDVRKTKGGPTYLELHDQPMRSELSGRPLMEVDGGSTEKGFPLSELPAYSHR